jgi:predicted RNase H-like nuclease
VAVLPSHRSPQEVTRLSKASSSPPRAILGIDAAWTATQPSGVALVVEGRGGWRCAAVAPSYEDFARLAGGAPVDWNHSPKGTPPPAPRELVDAVRRLAPEATLTVVAVDMPLARTPITCRRKSDDDVSREFGGRHCSTHSPSAERPGPIADAMRRDFAAAGFPLRTHGPTPRPGEASLIEVYPHTALLALCKAEERVPYKASRARAYWPGLEPLERKRRLLAEWARMRRALEREITGIDLPLPRPDIPLARLKRHEDALDALVCAWVGLQLLLGRACSFGDGDAAIWTPVAACRHPGSGAGSAAAPPRDAIT